ncbi:hypothetical protein LINGRAHAP2_LOCUS1903 [Linum grandiflorum]
MKAAPKPPYPVSGSRRPTSASSSPTGKGDRESQHDKKRVRAMKLDQAVRIEDVKHDETQSGEFNDEVN